MENKNERSGGRDSGKREWRDRQRYNCLLVSMNDDVARI
jgi:hypothetical protein